MPPWTRRARLLLVKTWAFQVRTPEVLKFVGVRQAQHGLVKRQKLEVPQVPRVLAPPPALKQVYKVALTKHTVTVQAWAYRLAVVRGLASEL